MLTSRLGNKILLAMIGVILTMSAAFLIYFVRYVGGVLEERAHDEGRTLVLNLSRSSELGILTEEDRFLRGPFKGVLSSSPVMYVMAYDLNGKLIKVESKVRVDPALPQTILKRMPGVKEAFFIRTKVTGEPDLVDYYAPVFRGAIDEEADEDFLGVIGGGEGELIGLVRMGMSGADIAEARRRVVLFGISLALIVFLIATVVVLILARQITMPLAKLGEGASRVAKGDLGFKIQVTARDEVGELADSFNRMTTDLERTTVSRDYINNILGSMIDTLVVVDEDNIVQTVNEALCQLLGFRESDLVGQPFSIMLDDPTVMVTREWDRFLAGGVLRDFELNYITKSGERIPMNFTGAIMEDKSRGIKSIVGVAHDMREILRLMQDLERRRRETEQARNEVDMERHRLMSLLSSISEGVLMFDPQGEVVVANPFARRLFRLPSEGGVTRDVLRAISWLNIDELMKDVHATPHKNLYREVEINFPIPQVIRIATSRVLAMDGRELGLVMVLHDVTEERQMDRMKDEFVATVSHDLRTPLTSIKGFVALLLGGKAGELMEKQRQFLKHVEESTDHLHRLINDLLDLSRIRAGKLVLQIENVDIRNVIESSARLNHPAAEDKRLDLKTNLPEDQCMVDIDVERMKEVFNNLISNAIKYTPENGEVEVSLFRRTDSCEITVRDTGIGISREHQAVIFDKFRSVPQAGKEISLSTGLGLSIVKGIVEAHRGSVWVESELGKGSIFHVNLPKTFETV